MQYKALAILTFITALTMVAAFSINWLGWLAWAAALVLAAALGAFAGAMLYFGNVTSIDSADDSEPLTSPIADNRRA